MPRPLVLAVLVLSACRAPVETDAGAVSPTDAAFDAGTDAAPPVPLLPVTGCPGERPTSLDECVWGDGWVDCHGDGAPRFACEDGSSFCAWFEGGCVPSSFVVSPCPAEDLCCVAGSAFAAGAIEEWRYRTAPYQYIFGRGREPLDIDSLARLDVVVDPTLEVGELVLECSETHSLCPEPYRGREPEPPQTRLDRTDDTFTLAAWRQSFGGVALEVEVLPEDPTRARACIRFSTDAVGNQCPAEPTPPYRCADEGTLTIEALPPARSGTPTTATHLEARFDDLTVTLALPPRVAP